MSKKLELFDKLIAGGSTDPFHHYARALELRSLGRPVDALEALVAVTASFPEYVPSYLIAAQLAQELGSPERARGLTARGVEVATRVGNDHALSELTALLSALPA
jgi:hypothetical protein